MRRDVLRRNRLGRLALVGLILLVLGGGPGHGGAKAAGYWGPGYRICRALNVGPGGPLYISASNVRCRKAFRIIREWWRGPDSRQTTVDDTTGGHVLLDRFPGWVCASGASAGGCHKGNRHAAYNFFEPRPMSSSLPAAERAALVVGCPTFSSRGLTFREIQRQRHVRCGLVRRLLRGTYSGCGYRQTWPGHSADGSPYGRPTCWFRHGWRCSTGAGGAVCWSATRPKLNVIDVGAQQLHAITVEV
jgi:hypothetical protein